MGAERNKNGRTVRKRRNNMVERLKERSQYVQICNAVVRFGGLTLSELGLYSLMLVRPDHWDFYATALAKETGLSKGEIVTMLRNMERKGFVRERAGRYGNCWDLFEVPERVAKAAAEAAAGSGQESRPVEPSEQPPAPDAGQEKGSEDEVCPSPRCDAHKLTHEQMAQTFFDQANKLKRIAEARKAEEEAARHSRLYGA
jgi:DNA-binding MarR family transcriptional regulator